MQQAQYIIKAMFRLKPFHFFVIILKFQILLYRPTEICNGISIFLTILNFGKRQQFPKYDPMDLLSYLFDLSIVTKYIRKLLNYAFFICLTSISTSEL